MKIPAFKFILLLGDMFMKKSEKYIILIILLSVISLFCLYSGDVTDAVGKALNMCADVLIPSLLPFFVVSNIIIKLNLINLLPRSIQMTFLFVLSMISGYPVGANLLNECVENSEISYKQAQKLLPCFINAGPGFTINFIGNSLLENTNLGLILFLGQCFSSVIMFIALGGYKIKLKTKTSVITLSEAISSSVSKGFNSTKNICIYVMLFFALIKLNEKLFGNKVSIVFAGFSEVTTAVLLQNNIFVISMLLSWCGFCVYLQIISVTSYKFSLIKVIVFRVLHGAVSVIITKILLMIFKVTDTVFSNTNSNTIINLPDNYTYFILIIFSIICFISATHRKSSGKLQIDLL